MITKYAGQPGVTGPSPAIWSRLAQEHATDPMFGTDLWDDFLTWEGSVASNVGKYQGMAGGYSSFESTGTTLAQGNADKGVVTAAVPATDNTAVVLKAGQVNAAVVNIGSATARRVFFETRLAKSQITSGDVFVGLAEAGLSDGAAKIITDTTGQLADVDYIGFLISAGTARAVYNLQTADAAVEVATGLAVTAATYHTFALVYDPNDDEEKVLRYYLNGREVGSVAADTLPATFPLLAPHWVVKATAAAAVAVSIDWWRLWIER